MLNNTTGIQSEKIQNGGNSAEKLPYSSKKKGRGNFRLKTKEFKKHISQMQCADLAWVLI